MNYFFAKSARLDVCIVERPFYMNIQELCVSYDLLQIYECVETSFGILIFFSKYVKVCLILRESSFPKTQKKNSITWCDMTVHCQFKLVDAAKQLMLATLA
jgi:hypothetical protein